MRTSSEINESELAKSLAAEDIRCGDMVAVLDMVVEYPSFLWSEDPQVLSPEEPVRVPWRCGQTGRPLRVKAICLPYVLVKAPDGSHTSLDTRQCRLVRLSRRYAGKAWKKLRKSRRKGS